MVKQLAAVTWERDRLLQELEIVHYGPRLVGPDNPSRCHMCHRGRSDELKIVDLSRRYAQLFLCYECVDKLHEWVHRST